MKWPPALSGHLTAVGLLKQYCNQTRETRRLETLVVEARFTIFRPSRRKTPARNELPSDVVQAMIQEYRRGTSTYQLAAWHGVRRNTVRDVLRRNGIQVSEGNRAKLSLEQKDAIQVKRACGATMRALCAEFGVSESTIRRALAELTGSLPPVQASSRAETERTAPA